MKNLPQKVVLVHEFLTQYGGGERILEAFTEMFPKAKIFTLIHDPKAMRGEFSDQEIVTSPLQNLPFARRFYKWLLPFYPWAIERMVIPTDTDLVISDSSAFAKGIKVPKGIPHLCYLHTPTRYLWSDRESYLKTSPAPAILRPLVKYVLDQQKKWDYLAAQQPDYFIANSEFIRQRLQKYYDRDADKVIFPYVDSDKFQVGSPGDYFLIVTRLEPYKKVDLAIESAIKAKVRLKVVGGGTRLDALRNRYQNQGNILFLGRVADQALPDLYAGAKAFIFPQEEDAGITPLEAMASGCPVLAYRAGGALESVVESKTGQFFDAQTVESLSEAIVKYDWERYNRDQIRKHAQKFDLKNFKVSITDSITELMNKSR